MRKVRERQRKEGGKEERKRGRKEGREAAWLHPSGVDLLPGWCCPGSGPLKTPRVNKQGRLVSRKLISRLTLCRDISVLLLFEEIPGLKEKSLKNQSN